MFELSFNTDNDAFKEDYVSECVRVLNRVIERLEEGQGQANLYDTNGNKIGFWTAS